MLPCLGGRGHSCLPRALFWWAVSPDPPGTLRQTQDSDSGGSWGRWALSSGSLKRGGHHPLLTSPTLPRPSLTQAHPHLEAGQQQQQCHQQRRLSPAKPHGQNKRPTVCLSKGLSAASRAPEAPLPVLGWGGRVWHLLLPLPGAPFSQTTGRTGLGAESVGPKDLASPGRGLNRIISCAARPARAAHPHSRRAWPGRGPGRGWQPWGPGSPSGSSAMPCGISSSKQFSNLAPRAPHGHPVWKGVILISQMRHRKRKGGLV